MLTDDFEARLDALKRAFGADTDSDLARQLGLTRFAVSKWRRTKTIPASYGFVLQDVETGPVGAAMLFIIRRDIYRHPSNGYFLRAALDLSNRVPTAQSASSATLERRLTLLMSLALDVCREKFGRDHCETEADYLEVVAAMSEPRHVERLQRALGSE